MKNSLKLKKNGKSDINNLKLIEPIRLKGYSEVWRASFNDKNVIVKISPWLKHEVEVLKLKLKGIPQLIKYIPGAFEEQDCIAMKELPGDSLRLVGPRLNYSEWKRVFFNIANLISRIDNVLGKRFVHGDLTADNIIVDFKLNTYLIDFTNWGLERARLVELKETFAAPEMKENKIATQQSDMFTLVKSVLPLMDRNKKAMLDRFINKLTKEKEIERPASWDEVMEML